MALALVIAFSGVAASSGRDSSERETGGLIGISPASGGDAGSSPAQSRSETCRNARKAVRYYRGKARMWAHKMGSGGVVTVAAFDGEQPRSPCPRYLVKVLRSKAHTARLRYERWQKAQHALWVYHYAWWRWMPDKWQRIGACETGYGRRPGDFHWNSGPYQGAFGFAVSSWDAFRLPGYPSEAYLATPRQQYEVALAIWRRYGYSGWGCRDA